MSQVLRVSDDDQGSRPERGFGQEPERGASPGNARDNEPGISGLNSDHPPTRVEQIKVLLFERDPEDALMLIDHLAGAQRVAAVVTQVDQVGETLTRLREEEYDALLLGLETLDNQGLEILSAIHQGSRQRPGTGAPNVPVIVLIAQDESASAIKALQSGAQDYLVKSELSSSQLERSILHSIERQRHQRELTKPGGSEESRLYEERFRALFDQAPSPIRVLSPDGSTLQVNKAWTEFSGMTLDQLDKRSILDEEWHVKTGTMPYLRKVFAGETTDFPLISYEPPEQYTQTLGRPPRKYWMKASAYAVKNSDGSVQEVVMMTQDVTEQKEAEEALRMSEERFRGLFEQSPIPIHIYSPDGTTMQVNRAWADLYGVTMEWAARYNLLQDPNLTSSGALPEVHRAFAGEATPLPTILVDPEKLDSQGHKRWVNGFAYPVKDQAGTMREVVFVVQDVTKQKEAEEELREKEEQYRSIFNATSDGLVIHDMDGIAVEVNPVFCEMHGYTREELIGTDLSILHDSEDVPAFQEFIDIIKSGRTFGSQGTHLHRRKDGTLFNVEVHGTAFAYNGGPHILAVIRDVTERVRAYELLEQRVEERTRELSTLLDVSNNVASTLDLEPLLGRILDEVKLIADNSAASIVVKVGGGLKMYDTRSTPVPQQWEEGGPLLPQSPLERMGIIWEALSRGETVIIPDVRGTTPMALAMQEAAGLLLDTAFADTCSWLAVPLSQKEQVIGMLSISHAEPGYYTDRHATLARAIANQAAVAIENARLYEQAQEASRVTGALAQIASRVAFGGSLDTMLHDLCEHVVGATGAVAASVALRNEGSEEILIVGAHGLPEGYMAAFNSILASGVSLLAQEAVEGRRPVVVRNMRDRLLNSPPYAPLHKYMGLVSWDTVVAVPLLYHDQVTGILFSYHPPTRNIEESEIAFHTAIADQATVAIENARLYEQAQQTTGMTAALAQIASRVAFGGSLEDMLDDLCRHVVKATGAIGSLVALIEPTSKTTRVAGGHGLPEGYNEAMNEVLSSGARTLTNLAAGSHRPVVYSDIRRIVLGSSEYAPLHEYMGQVKWDTLVTVPMVYGDNPVGVLISYHAPTRKIEEAELALHMAIASQAAVAVQNALLLTEVQGKAALEERQKLARELHDSVSQAIFSISLQARTAQTLLRGDPDRVEEPLGHIASLSQAAMAEMRALIFELRPESLQNEGLVAAVAKQASALHARHNIEVQTELCDEPPLTLEQKQVVFRIAQEALHNTVKHARASQVSIKVECDERWLTLDVKDNGVGFDPTGMFPGHLGLQSMRERAAKLGGTVQIESVPGHGTCIRLRLPVT